MTWIPASPVLARHCSESLLQMVGQNQGDPLGYVSFGGMLDDTDCEVDRINFMDELAADALRGDQPYVLSRLMEWPTLRRMDEVTAALLRGMRIIPEAALALSDALGKARSALEIADGDDDLDRILVNGNETGWAVQIDYGRTAWNSRGYVVLPAMPATLREAAGGRPLRDLVSHPVLDRFDLTVDGVSGTENGTTVALSPGWASFDKAALLRGTRELARAEA